jgi:hypothetical protein
MVKISVAILFTDLQKKFCHARLTIVFIVQWQNLYSQNDPNFLPFDCEKNLITLAKNSHKIPRKFIISVPEKLKGGKFKALLKGQKQSVNEWKTRKLASPAQILTLYTTHADRAFLSKLVMHNKQALSRFSSAFEAIKAGLSACNAQFYVFVSSTYVCALERGRIWGFWGTWEFSRWKSLVVA